MENLINNNQKMQWMAKEFRDEYFRYLGNCILNGLTLQQSIDGCFNYFSKIKQ